MKILTLKLMYLFKFSRVIMRKSGLTYCGQVVQEQDRDRFLLSLFAPVEARPDLWALFAFNHEIAKTREVVTETRLGLIRLQWWREAIAKIYDEGHAPDHEILQALKTAIQKYNLPREEFETLLYAREFDLEDVQPANIEGLINYADFTTTPLNRLALRTSGGEPDMEPVQPVSVNYALAGILRSVAFHAAHKRCLLPEDVMKERGVNAYVLYEGKKQDGLANVAREVAGHIVPGISPHSRFLRATQKLAQIYAERIRGLEYEVMNPKMQIPPPFKELRVLTGVTLG
jgi:NADH dehydrogenase [ubiquinone] 1 alpha subcomplex assembly factor 6